MNKIYDTCDRILALEALGRKERSETVCAIGFLFPAL